MSDHIVCTCIVYYLTLSVHCHFRNALSFDMLTQLGDAIVNAYKTPETKTLIIKAEGKVFSAGHDLRELVSACLSIRWTIIDPID